MARTRLQRSFVITSQRWDHARVRSTPFRSTFLVDLEKDRPRAGKSIRGRAVAVTQLLEDHVLAVPVGPDAVFVQIARGKMHRENQHGDQTEIQDRHRPALSWRDLI